jgi:hypothetical protein
MDLQASQPSQIAENPILPPGTSPLVMEMFEGVNTATLRAGVPDQQAYWMDGFIPFAQRNARVLYGVGTTLYTAAGTTVVWFDFINIGSTPYAIIFLANGQVVAVNTSTAAATTILNAGTITSPTIVGTGISQWGSQYLIIVADQTNGYWLWDGSHVFLSGTLAPTVSITNMGGGYPSTVTVNVVGGHGTGASVTASVTNGQVTSASVVAPGSGYSVNDSVIGIITPAPTSGSGGSVTVTGVTSVAGIGWSVTAVSVVAAGSLYVNPSVTFSLVALAPGSIISQPVGDVIATGGSLTTVILSNHGLLSASTVPVVNINDLAANASITLDIMPFGIQGTDAETYAGRVWVIKRALVNYTAPGSTSDFSTSNGGGNFTSNDSYLKVGYTRLFQTNGFLYLIADSSVDYISGVQTSGVPPTTTYTKQNADPEVGTPYPASAILQGQNIMFANSVGIYVLNGSRAQKVSDWLDNTYNSVANFGGLQLSAAEATIFGRKVWMTLVQIVDPVSGSTVNKCLMWDGKRWWASGQDITLTYIKSQEINSVITAYGTNGTIITPLFSAASTAFQKTIQSKLWDAPGSLLTAKAVNRFWGLFNYNSVAASVNLTLTIDGVGVSASGQYANSNTYTITGPVATGYFVTPPEAVGQVGVLNGFTIKTNAADMSMLIGMLEPVPVAYRG